jgi:hypothetical protein
VVGYGGDKPRRLGHQIPRGKPSFNRRSKMKKSKAKVPYESTLQAILKLKGSAPSQAHSTTSQEAATSILIHSKSIRAKVWKYLVNKDTTGATDQQIQIDLRLDPSTERPRRRELVLQGFVKDSGFTKKTRSGHNATIWVAVLPKYTPKQYGKKQ